MRLLRQEWAFREGGGEVAGQANDWGVGFSHVHVPGDVAGVGVFFLCSSSPEVWHQNPEKQHPCSPRDGWLRPHCRL